VGTYFYGDWEWREEGTLKETGKGEGRGYRGKGVLAPKPTNQISPTMVIYL